MTGVDVHFRVQTCAEHVQKRVLCVSWGIFYKCFCTLMCGGDLKTFANVYPGVIVILAYFFHTL